MSFRDSASFGKRQEFVAIAELLRRGFDVYLTLVDDKQIDCLVRREVKGKPVYLDIQIKARSKRCNLQNAGGFAGLKVLKPRANFFFLFYSERLDTYWVLPSTKLVREASQNKTGRNKGLYTLYLASLSRKTGKVTPRPKFEKYRNNFDILKEWKGRL